MSSISTRDEPTTRAVATHGWIDTETVTTRLGSYEFKGGYPTEDSTRRLTGQLVYNRAVEVYLSQMPVVSFYHVWKGTAEAGSGVPNQLVIWETLMDAQTLLLTGNTETVYGLCAIDLKRDGPVVIEVPPKLLGGVTSLWQGELLGIGPTGADKGQGAKFLLLPPAYEGKPPQTYMIARSPTYRVILGVRGFQVDGKTASAVALMQSAKVYPLSKAASPPAMTFVNGSGQPIDTLFPDTDQYFDDLATIVESEPVTNFSMLDRFQIASIGIEQGRTFAPNAERSKLLYDAARFASGVARANSFDNTDAERLVYTDRLWEWAFIGGSATWDSQGYLNTDRRAAFAYIAIGMSPAMVEKVVGQGSQYLTVYRDKSGAYLDGGKRYRLRLPANIPVKNFWSFVVYDARSRSLLQNGQPFPSVSTYTSPDVNADGSIDIHLGPDAPQGHEKNWIKTIPGVGWFPLLRLYGPLQPFFDKTWKPDDIVDVKQGHSDMASNTETAATRAGVARPSDRDISDAYIYLLGRLTVTRQQQLDFQEGFKWNELVHRKPGAVDWPNPNLDVAYSEAWVAADENSYVLVNVPRITDRYYTVQFLNGWGETLANINARTFADRPYGDFAVCLKGSSVAVPSGVRRVDLPVKYSRVLLRVELGADWNKATALQQRFSFKAVGSPALPTIPKTPIFDLEKLPGVEAFDAAVVALGSEVDINPGMEQLQANVRAIAKAVKDPAERARVDKIIRERAWPEFADAGTMIGHGTIKNNWVRPKVCGAYADDWLARSCIDYGGIWANVLDEVLYYKGRIDSTDAPLHSDNTYTLTFPKDDLPAKYAKYFWSVIAVDAKQMRVLPNPLNRFLLNNQSKLEYGKDGSLTLYFASGKPNDAPEGNWLPTLGKQNYSLTFRFYGPQGGVADGSYYPPPLIKRNK